MYLPVCLIYLPVCLPNLLTCLPTYLPTYQPTFPSVSIRPTYSLLHVLQLLRTNCFSILRSGNVC